MQSYYIVVLNQYIRYNDFPQSKIYIQSKTAFIKAPSILKFNYC